MTVSSTTSRNQYTATSGQTVFPYTRAKNDLTADMVNELLEYKDGDLFWKNGKKAGTLSKHGYISVGINKKYYKAHRLIWLMHYGQNPKGTIDHIDQNKSNNRIENLRDCSESENRMNQKAYKSNTSGFKGVSFNKNANLYTAYAGKGSKKYCAYFKEKSDAVEFSELLRNELHGKFACH